MLCSLIRTMCSTTPTSLLHPNKHSTMSASPALTVMEPPTPPPSPAMSMMDDFSDDHPRKIKVMIIDDNTINLSILSRLLNKHFADTVQLTSVQNSGLSALDQLTKSEVDLILMDIDMPELSGVETTTAIRSNNSHTEKDILEQNTMVPIIAVTTSDAQEQRELYRQVGMSDCVSKPIDIPKLRSAIEVAMKSIPTVTG